MFTRILGIMAPGNSCIQALKLFWSLFQEFKEVKNSHKILNEHFLLRYFKKIIDERFIREREILFLLS